jgi:hypothetical protein
LDTYRHMASESNCSNDSRHQISTFSDFDFVFASQVRLQQVPNDNNAVGNFTKTRKRRGCIRSVPKVLITLLLCNVKLIYFSKAINKKGMDDALNKN